MANTNPTHLEAQPVQPLVQINGGSTAPEIVRALDELNQRLQHAGVGAGLARLHLEHSATLADEVAVLHRLAGLEATLQVTPSTFPLIGPLITRLKQALHQLVLFYVRDLAAQQNAFNAQTARLVQRLAHAPTEASWPAEP